MRGGWSAHGSAARGRPAEPREGSSFGARALTVESHNAFAHRSVIITHTKEARTHNSTGRQDSLAPALHTLALEPRARRGPPTGESDCALCLSELLQPTPVCPAPCLPQPISTHRHQPHPRSVSLFPLSLSLADDSSPSPSEAPHGRRLRNEREARVRNARALTRRRRARRPPPPSSP